MLSIIVIWVRPIFKKFQSKLLLTATIWQKTENHDKTTKLASILVCSHFIYSNYSIRHFQVMVTEQSKLHLFYSLLEAFYLLRRLKKLLLFECYLGYVILLYTEVIMNNSSKHWMSVLYIYIYIYVHYMPLFW